MAEFNDNYTLLIQKLDHFIRKFYTNQLLKGTLYSAGVVLGLFLLINLLEYNFYFHTTARKLVFFLFILISIAAISKWVVLPAMHYFRLGNIINHEQAADIIGNHFTDVKDKLLNILQLKKQSYNAVETALINASINQKSEEIKPVPFKAAIDLKENKKYLKYALPPLLLLLGVMLFDSSIIRDSTYRLINNNKEFVKPAPFAFILKNDQLKVGQNEDYALQITTQGSVIPNEVFVEIGGHEYRLKKEAHNVFSYVFSNCQKDTEFRLLSGDVSSATYQLSVLLKPNIKSFVVTLNYPDYTGRQDETVTNVGDVLVPAGTKILWNFSTDNTSRLSYKFGNESKTVAATKRGESEYSFSLRAMNNMPYTVFFRNELLPNADSVNYNLSVIPDAYPVISVQRFDDSTNRRLVYFVGDVSDDYGLRNLTFNYKIKKYKAAEGPLNTERLQAPQGINGVFNYSWDLRKLNLNPGDEINYYFEVYDNDAVNGSKPARTSMMSYKMPTVDELEQLTSQNSEEIKKDLEKSLRESKKIEDELQKIREKLLQKKEIDWQTRKELEKLLERQKQVEKQIQQAKQKFEENLQNQNETSEPKEDVEQKQEQLKSMFDDVMQDKMKDLLQQIQDLLQQMDKDQTLQKMDEMKKEQKQSSQTMERLKELYKQLEVEKNIQDIVNKLEELSEKQEKLSDQTEKNEKSQDQLQKEQSEMQKEFEKLQQKMDETDKQNKQLDKPKNFDQQKEKSDDVKDSMQKSQEDMKQGANSKASQKQKKAARKMKEMAQSMSEQAASGDQEQAEEDYNAMRQLMENLISLSFDEEETMTQFVKTPINTPKYTELGQRQKRIKDDFKMVEDSLFALSKRVSQIETFILEKVAEVNLNMDNSLSNIQERYKPQAQDFQQRTMKNLNDLALMLDEAMNNMQQQMSNKSGSKNCKKPGGKSSSSGSDRKPQDKMSKSQKGINEDMKKMMEGTKNGEGQPKSKEFAEMAARQAALRKMIENMKKQNQEQGKGAGENKILDELIQDMNKTEKDLVNKRLNNEMLKRQKEIETKLLESERAEREREFDNKRKAEQADQIDNRMPPALKEYIKKRQSEIELYKDVNPSLKIYYKNLVEEYFKTLKSS
ncbi:MAG: DUF4175 domain-containing protein [Saprospiraceae bacterium]|nr:DUF4175 domain-containing protein [Saprospiraceae bacterium]